MNLILDIGNTRTKLALFDKGRLINKQTVDKLEIDFLKNIKTNHSTEKVIYSVTGSLDEAVAMFLQNEFEAVELTELTPLPVINSYQTPQTLGKDRIAGMVGAYELFPGQNCMVIDTGTCITYDFLTETGEYIGGNIAPGGTMRLKAMHYFTARLPLVHHPGDFSSYGTSTESAMVNGAWFGILMEVEGYIKWYEEKFPLLKVIMTGGDADFFVKKMKRKIFVHPDLVLVGLNKILNFNA